jgi:hypothetical protein
MRSTRSLAIALLLAASGGGVRAEDEFGKSLEACIDKARHADATCSRMTDAPTQRLECFEKARADQLNCLEHALSDAPTGATASDHHLEAAQPEQPAKIVTPAPTLQPQPQQEGVQATAQRSPQESSSQTPQANSPENAQARLQDSSQDLPQITTRDTPATSWPEQRKDDRTAKAPADATHAVIDATTSQLPASQPAERSTAAIQSEAPDTAKDEPKEALNAPKPSAPQAKPPEPGWLVSETTSPIDYRLLLTAVIRPASNSPGGPSRLAVRCRGAQTELLIQTEGTWQAPPKKGLIVDRQVNDQPVVRAKWTLSTDAKTATYADDTIDLLKSLPEGARLTLSVFDGANAKHDAAFLLTGWEAIRTKIEAACKWPKVNSQASSGHR